MQDEGWGTPGRGEGVPASPCRAIAASPPSGPEAEGGEEIEDRKDREDVAVELLLAEGHHEDEASGIAEEEQGWPVGGELAAPAEQGVDQEGKAEEHEGGGAEQER